tara:strand:- start:539 stop:1702 length:1164 start_codon:yes stop_codon:yes gene_type:complete
MVNIDPKQLTRIIRNIYGKSEDKFIPLHEPRFISDEKEVLIDCIDSTFVSTVGRYVAIFEDAIKSYTGAKYAIATSNGTSALHVALIACGVMPKDEVITQAFTFIATCNAIKYCHAEPVFVDISRENLGMCSNSLRSWITSNTIRQGKDLINKNTGARIAAVLPMNTFGHPCDLVELSIICKEFNIPLVEDSAEALGSSLENKHLGTFGDIGTLSFNGNKVITTGGGGAVITNNEEYAEKVRHLATTARVASDFTFEHNAIGYNYRMPNLNACLGVSQMKSLHHFIDEKRSVAEYYKDCFNDSNIEFFTEPLNSKSNYWLNTIIFENKNLRDLALEYTNNNSVMTRPPWKLMNKLEMFSKCEKSNLEVSEDLESRILNIPSSVPQDK